MSADIILRIGAAAKTPIGLLGFLIGCGCLVYLAMLRKRIQEVRALPKDARATATDGSLSKYGMIINDAPSHVRAKLIGQELRNNIIKAALVAFVFLTSLAMIIHSINSISTTPSNRQNIPGPDDVDPNNLVIQYKTQILELRGSIEARNPALETEQRRRSLQLAGLIGAIDESQLGPASKIIKHEYGGWAFLMNVCTFSGTPPPAGISGESRLRYAKRSVAELDEALNVMDEIRHDCGKNRAICEWMTGRSEDINRTHYLKAIALAVIAQAGGGVPKAVNDELSLVSDTYLTTFPVVNNPDLVWATGNHTTSLGN